MFKFFYILVLFHLLRLKVLKENKILSYRIFILMDFLFSLPFYQAIYLFILLEFKQNSLKEKYNNIKHIKRIIITISRISILLIRKQV